VPAVYAQDTAPTNFKEAFLQLNLRMEDYNKAHDEYVLRRSQYLRFKSLQSESDARAATADLLKKRDDVVIAYLVSLKLRMAETPGITSDQKSPLDIRIDEEIDFYKDHKANVPSAGSLTDLVEDSQKAQTRYKENEDLFFNTLFIVSNGKVSDFYTRLTESLTGIKAKVGLIREEQRDEYKLSQTKLDAIDRFIFESENKLVRAQEKQLEAFKTTPGQKYSADNYSERLRTLTDAQGYLREVSSFLKEVINQMKDK
jgi:hypothetical protein